MFSFPIQILPADLAAETAALNEKLAKGISNLTHLTDDDIDIGSTPKDIILEQDGIKVYHYHALVDQSKIMKTPLLIVPPLINGYEVADLQPDRSLVRNLLNEGIDVYLNDWGYPRQVDKFRTVDDYINGYLDDTVDFIRKYHGVDKIALFGICQGGHHVDHLLDAQSGQDQPPHADRVADRFRRLQGEPQAARGLDVHHGC
jgi:polyhydroxyalkanoate synthase